MDPDQVLAEIRKAIADFDAVSSETWTDPITRNEHRLVHAVTVVDGVHELDEWITRGGFLPAAWQSP